MEIKKVKNAGFSLPEMMLAIALFGIGFAMALAMFPAAMKDHTYIKKTMLGTIVSENGLSYARGQIPHREQPNGNLINPFSAPPAPKQGYLSVPNDASLRDIPYIPSLIDPPPPGVTSTPFYDKGCLVIGRYYEITRNDYQLMSIAYDKIGIGDVQVVEITCTVSGKNVTSASASDAQFNPPLRVGTPLIHRNTGRFAFVRTISNGGTAGTLNREIGGDLSLNDYYIVQEDGQPFLSPALSLQITRTPLPEQTTSPGPAPSPLPRQ